MLIPTMIMATFAVVLIIIGHVQGGGVLTGGLRMALKMTLEVLPLLFASLIVAGMVQVLIPRELVVQWIGAESGLRGIIIGSIAGGLTPGGPYVCLPIVAGLFKTGAGAGTLVAFLTGWSLWAVSRLPLEIGILGWRLTAIRFGATLIFPPLAGIIARSISVLIKV